MSLQERKGKESKSLEDDQDGRRQNNSNLTGKRVNKGVSSAKKISYRSFKNMLKFILGSEDEWYKQRNHIQG